MASKGHHEIVELAIILAMAVRTFVVSLRAFEILTKTRDPNRCTFLCGLIDDLLFLFFNRTQFLRNAFVEKHYGFGGNSSSVLRLPRIEKRRNYVPINVWAVELAVEAKLLRNSSKSVEQPFPGCSLLRSRSSQHDVIKHFFVTKQEGSKDGSSDKEYGNVIRAVAENG